MKLLLKKDVTSQTALIFIQDKTSTQGAGLAGLAYNTATLTWYYYREGQGTGATAVTLATMTLGTWASGGFVEVDATDMPGWYEIGIPNAALATGADFVGMQLKGGGNMAQLNLEIELVGVDLADGVRMGLTALPAAAADAAGGLPISDAGGLDLDAKLANTNEVTAARMGALTDWINGGRLDLILDTLALESTLTAIKGATFSGATDSLEALRDRGDAAWITATGFATPTNITAGTITTVTNLTNLPAAAALEATLTAMKGATYAEATDSLEALRNRGDAAWVTATGFAVAGDAMALTAGERTTLTASIWNALTSGMSTVGSIGKKLADWVVGTIDTYTGNTKQTADVSALITTVGVAGAGLTAITGKTDNLPTDPADESLIIAATDAIVTVLTAMKGATFDGATDSLEALRNRGDAAWVTGTPPTAAAIADQVLDEVLSGHAVAGSTGAALSSASAPTAAAVADAVWDEALSGHAVAGSAGAALSAAGSAGDPWSTLVPGAYAAGTAGYKFGNIVVAGSGAITWTYTVTDSVTSLPIADVDVWVTSDSGGANVLASGKTNANGVVTFYLDAGTVYVWSQKTGYNFTNPDTEVVA